jgi:hypothetical protein
LNKYCCCLYLLLLLLLLQGGVSVFAWVAGHMMFDLLGLLLHPALFFAWLYVLTLSHVPAYAYYMALVSVGGYTSGVGYLVSDCSYAVAVHAQASVHSL